MEIPIHVEWIRHFLVDQLHAFSTKSRSSRVVDPETFSNLSSNRSLLFSSNMSSFCQHTIYSLALSSINKNFDYGTASFKAISSFLCTNIDHIDFTVEELESPKMRTFDIYDRLASNIMTYYLYFTIKPSSIDQNIVGTGLDAYEVAFEKWIRACAGNSSQTHFFRPDFLYDIGTAQSVSIILSKVRPDLVRLDRVTFGTTISTNDLINNWRETEVSLIVLGLKKPDISELNDKLCILCFLADFYVVLSPLLIQIESRPNITTVMPSLIEQHQNQATTPYSCLQRIDMLLDKINQLTEPSIKHIENTDTPPLFKPVNIISAVMQPSNFDNSCNNNFDDINITSNKNQNKDRKELLQKKPKFEHFIKPIITTTSTDFETELQIIRNDPNSKKSSVNKNNDYEKKIKPKMPISDDLNSSEDSSFIDAKNIPKRIVKAKRLAPPPVPIKDKPKEAITNSEQRLIFQQVRNILNKNEVNINNEVLQRNEENLPKIMPNRPMTKIPQPKKESDLFFNYNLAEQLKNKRQKIVSKPKTPNEDVIKNKNEKDMCSPQRKKYRVQASDSSLDDDSYLSPPPNKSSRKPNVKQVKSNFNNERKVVHSHRSKNNKNDIDSDSDGNNERYNQKIETKKGNFYFEQEDSIDHDSSSLIQQHIIPKNKPKPLNQASEKNKHKKLLSESSSESSPLQSPPKSLNAGRHNNFGTKNNKNEGYLNNFQKRKQLLIEKQKPTREKQKIVQKEEPLDEISPPIDFDASPKKSKIPTKTNAPSKISALKNMINEKEENEIMKKHSVYKKMVPNPENESIDISISNLIPEPKKNQPKPLIDNNRNQKPEKNQLLENKKSNNKIKLHPQNNKFTLIKKPKTEESLTTSNSSFEEEISSMSEKVLKNTNSSLRSFIETEKRLKENPSIVSLKNKSFESKYQKEKFDEEEEEEENKDEEEEEESYLESPQKIIHQSTNNERSKSSEKYYSGEQSFSSSKIPSDIEVSDSNSIISSHSSPNKSKISDSSSSKISDSNKQSPQNLQNKNYRPPDQKKGLEKIFRNQKKSDQKEQAKEETDKNNQYDKKLMEGKTNKNSQKEENTRKEENSQKEENIRKEENNQKYTDPINSFDFIPNLRSSDSDSFDEDPLLALGKAGFSSSELYDNKSKTNNISRIKNNEKIDSTKKKETPLSSEEIEEESANEDVSPHKSLNESNNKKLQDSIEIEEEEEDVNDEDLSHSKSFDKSYNMKQGISNEIEEEEEEEIYEGQLNKSISSSIKLNHSSVGLLSKIEINDENIEEEEEEGENNEADEKAEITSENISNGYNIDASSNYSGGSKNEEEEEEEEEEAEYHSYSVSASSQSKNSCSKGSKESKKSSFSNNEEEESQISASLLSSSSKIELDEKKSNILNSDKISYLEGKNENKNESFQKGNVEIVSFSLTGSSEADESEADQNSYDGDTNPGIIKSTNSYNANTKKAILSGPEITIGTSKDKIINDIGISKFELSIPAESSKSIENNNESLKTKDFEKSKEVTSDLDLSIPSSNPKNSTCSLIKTGINQKKEDSNNNMIVNSSEGNKKNSAQIPESTSEKYSSNASSDSYKSTLKLSITSSSTNSDFLSIKEPKSPTVILTKIPDIESSNQQSKTAPPQVKITAENITSSSAPFNLSPHPSASTIPNTFTSKVTMSPNPINSNDSKSIQSNESIPIKSNESILIQSNESIPIQSNESIPIQSNGSKLSLSNIKNGSSFQGILINELDKSSTGNSIAILNRKENSEVQTTPLKKPDKNIVRPPPLSLKSENEGIEIKFDTNENTSPIKPLEFDNFDILIHEKSIVDSTPVRTPPSKSKSVIDSPTFGESSLNGVSEISAICLKNPTHDSPSANRRRLSSLRSDSNDLLRFSCDDDEDINDGNDSDIENVVENAVENEEHSLSMDEKSSDMDSSDREDLFNSVVTLPSDTLSSNRLSSGSSVIINNGSKINDASKHDLFKEENQSSNINSSSSLSLSTQKLPDFDDAEKTDSKLLDSDAIRNDRIKSDLGDMILSTHQLPEFDEGGENESSIEKCGIHGNIIINNTDVLQEAMNLNTDKLQKFDETSSIISVPKIEKEYSNLSQNSRKKEDKSIENEEDIVQISAEVSLPIDDEEDIEEDDSLKFTEDVTLGLDSLHQTKNNNSSVKPPSKSVNSVRTSVSALRASISAKQIQGSTNENVSKISDEKDNVSSSTKNETEIKNYNQFSISLLDTPSSLSSIKDNSSRNSSGSASKGIVNNAQSIGFDSETETQTYKMTIGEPKFVDSSKIAINQHLKPSNAMITTNSANVDTSLNPKISAISPPKVQSPKESQQRVTFDPTFLIPRKPVQASVLQIPFVPVQQAPKQRPPPLPLSPEDREMINDYLHDSHGENKSKYQSLSGLEEKALVQILPRAPISSQSELYDTISQELNISRTDPIVHRIFANITIFLGRNTNKNDPMSKTSSITVDTSSIQSNNEEEDDSDMYF